MEGIAVEYLPNSVDTGSNETKPEFLGIRHPQSKYKTNTRTSKYKTNIQN